MYFSGTILQYFNYVNTLQFNDAPDYIKCRKLFEAGLKALGHTNSGELDFKVTGKTTAVAASPKKPARKPAPTKTKAVTSTSSSDEVPPATTAKRTARKVPVAAVAKRTPPKRTTSKRTATGSTESDSDGDESEPEVLPAKKSRSTRTHEKENATATRNGHRHQQERSAAAATPPSASGGGGSMTVNNDILSKGQRKKDKTYEFNFELDVSLDANVVINVKRKPRKEKDGSTPVGAKKASTPLQKVLSGSVTGARARAASAASRKSDSLVVVDDDDCDEIEASPDVTPVASMRRLQKDVSRHQKSGAVGTPTTSGRK